MLKKLFLVLGLSLFITAPTLGAEVNWDVGLTAQRELISAKGVINNYSAATILYLGGLDGTPDSTSNLNQLLQNFSQASRAEDTNLIVIANGNPEAESLQFPPAGEAYIENTVSHVLWRWIGTQAPDLIIIEAGNDFGFGNVVSNAGIAGFGTIPVETLSAANSSVEFLLENADMARSPAKAELERRAARTPRALAEQLASTYGYDFSSPVYVPGMSVIGRMKLGYMSEVNQMLEPYLDGQEFEVSNSSALAGQLVFAEHATITGNQQSLELTLRAADLAFDENGEPLEVVPMHYEMSDSFLWPHHCSPKRAL